MKLPRLRPGDRIGLVAPASPFNREEYQRACRHLEESGFRVHPGEHIFEKRGYLCGTEAARAKDLSHALSDPQIAAVVCVRGGFGSGRLIPWVPFSGLHKNPKPFIGYSDITFLHQALQSQAGWVTLHGPNLVDMSHGLERATAVSETLQGLNPFEWQLQESQVLRHGTSRGILRGGNLTCLSHLVGTRFLPDLRGAILFLEDRGEALYRLDRLMMHLKLAGHLDVLGGLVLGQFTECAEPSDIWEMVLEYTHPFHLPIVADLPFGHAWPNDILPLGCPFLMDSRARVFKALSRPIE